VKSRSENGLMTNVTVSLPAGLLREVRQLAVDEGVSLSRFVARSLEERVEVIRKRLAQDTDHAAPHIIDVEVLGVIRRDFLSGNFDRTAAELALEELRDWPGIAATPVAQAVLPQTGDFGAVLRRA
jgi:predicted nucleic acid-binding protein